MVGIKAVFEFVADNPVTICFAGAILFFVLGGGALVIGALYALYYILIAFIFLFVAIALYQNGY